MTSASDAPVRTPGTRARSGNAMLRTRAAILDAAQRCVEADGVKRTTMSDIATTAGVAKATLYNHFRTKDDVLTALVEARVRSLAARAEAVAAGTVPLVPGQTAPELGLAAALALAGSELGAAPALRRLAADEPGALVRLCAPSGEDGWPVAREVVAAALTAAGVEAGPTAVEMVLRHLVAELLWPASPAQVRAGAAALAGVLGATTPEAAPLPAAASALGWPG